MNLSDQQPELKEDMEYLERVIRRPCPYCFDCLTYMQDHWYECDGFRVDNPGCIEYEKLVLQMLNRYAIRYTPKFHCESEQSKRRNKI